MPTEGVSPKNLRNYHPVSCLAGRRGGGDSQGEGWEEKGQWHIFAMQLLRQEEANGLVAVPVLTPLMDPSSGKGSELCLSGQSKPARSTNRKNCHQGSVKHQDGGN